MSKLNKNSIFGSSPLKKSKFWEKYYEKIKVLDKGHFGTIYLAQSKKTYEFFALKEEEIFKQNESRVLTEAKILNLFKGTPGFPELKYFFMNSDKSIMVMTMLDNTLKKIFKFLKKFTLKTVIIIAIQILERLEFLHNLGYVHCDLHPGNIMISKENPSIIYLIDFGISYCYLSNKDKKMHKSIERVKNIIGNINFASINSHYGFQLTRRDDLISLGYILIYFFTGELPWIDPYIKKKSMKQRIPYIFELKRKNSITFNLPKIFETYMNYCYKLEYHEKPDYSFLKNKFKEFALNNMFHIDFKYDWLKPDILDKIIKSRTETFKVKNLDNISSINLNLADSSKYFISKKTVKNIFSIQNLIMNHAIDEKFIH